MCSWLREVVSSPTRLCAHMHTPAVIYCLRLYPQASPRGDAETLNPKPEALGPNPQTLNQVELTGSSYLSCLEQLVAALQSRIAQEGVHTELKSHVEGFLKSQTAWSDAQHCPTLPNVPNP